MDYYTHLLNIIKDLSIFSYLVIAILAFFESFAFVGLIIPGSIAVIIGGFLASQGIIDIGDLFIFAVLGAILGDSFSFYLGRKGIISFHKDNKIFRPTLLAKGKKYFQKHGNKSVFFGRFIGWVRPIIPFIAGLFKLDKKVFLFWNILSGLLWATAHIALGYFFGQTWQLVVLWSARTSIFIFVFIGFLFIMYFFKWLILKKGKSFFAFLSSIWKSIKKAIAENPEVRKIVGKHKRFFLFLQKRLDKNNFYGLPLTFIFFALVYVIALFGGITEGIINSNIIVSADIRVANLLAFFRNTELTKFFFWITLLGKWQIILIFTIATILGLWLSKKTTYIIPLLLSIFGSEIFTYLGKIIFHRARPDIAIYTENSFSFPSGHATIAIAFYGFLTYFFIRNNKKWKNKINIFFASFITILLIGFSRLYLGVHYVSDVWGGYLAGAIWLIIAISLSEYLLSKKKKVEITRPNNKKVLVTTGIISLSIALYIIFAFCYQMPNIAKTKTIDKITIDNSLEIFNLDQLKYTETLLGKRQEPLSFVIIAKDNQQLINLFKNAGWSLADNASLISTYKISKASLLKQSYKQAPMTPDFWNSNVHNFGFEKETASTNVRTRHHARFWQTNYITKDKKNIYVGTASFDNGIKWGITHKINPDIDTEREFLFNDLQKTNKIANTKKESFVNPELGNNFSGDPFFTDGKLYILLIKD